ncbi:hypothetical protein N7E81_05480 [Reichenbachiella carrageenanivorans]|uniref:SbsA Ig-like domain-containing protein n=1 Tax=Reichenbachiella carrageenanivorans TaxID=2979869 RepID=A0ABY6D4K0_9BACT|nr:hypothetical protein [Reichenbachiella carrageenanivorans]UXX80550.1 hypothetical protein N7E81_05480 [Reichenbachiella carrageenanivorans]
MNKFLRVLGVVLVLASCDDPNPSCCDEPQLIVLGESFSIKEGETVEVESSTVTLTFSELLNDSLCPYDTTCLTNGTLAITINISGTNKTLSIGDQSLPTATYKNYTIELQRLIYPTKSDEKANNSSTYAVQMVITRA